MQIAVDTRFLQSAENPGYAKFTSEVFCRLANQHTEHRFLFLQDKVHDASFALPENVTTVTITPEPKNLITYKWWYDVKLPLALKKHQPDLFIGSYGFCSLSTPIPQVLIVHDLAFLHKGLAGAASGKNFYKKYFPAFIKRSKAVATLSGFVKEEIESKYTSDTTIKVISSGAADHFKPMEWEQREQIKEQYTAGCEYFVFTAGFEPASRLLNVLKAFSLFKKRQKTNMKLVITGELAFYKKEFEKLNTYKYRNELVILENLTGIEKAKVVAAAYAFIFTTGYPGFAAPVVEALQCEVPVIASAKTSAQEIAADAALYVDAGKPEEIAEEMKRVFKDEQLRSKLITAGKERAKLFTWNNTTTLLWQLIEEAVCK